MIKQNTFYFLLILLFTSCFQEKKSNEIDFVILKNVLINKNVNNTKTEHYSINISATKNEKDIWITSKNRIVYDSILKFYNEGHRTSSSNTSLNSWSSDTEEILLFRHSDSCILISILRI